MWRCRHFQSTSPHRHRQPAGGLRGAGAEAAGMAPDPPQRGPRRPPCHGEGGTRKRGEKQRKTLLLMIRTAVSGAPCLPGLACWPCKRVSAAMWSHGPPPPDAWLLATPGARRSILPPPVAGDAISFPLPLACARARPQNSPDTSRQRGSAGPF